MSLDLVQAALFLAPGFLALKLFHLFGAQRPRSEWEWTTWSVIVSLPIAVVAAAIRHGGDAAGQLPSDADTGDTAVRFIVALGIGLLAAIAWRLVRRSDRSWGLWVRRQVNDSAWDQALDDAVRRKRLIRVEGPDGAIYRGGLMYGGREDARASGWFYLSWPDKWVDGKFRAMARTEGILFDRDAVKVVRVLRSDVEGLRPDTLSSER